MAGRAGRGRGIQCLSLARKLSSTKHEPDGEPLLRGRGGFRPPPRLRMTPSNVTHTSGTGGTCVQVMANYFQLITSDVLIVYNYHVTFDPEVESRNMRNSMIREHQNSIGSVYTFNGHSNLKSTTRLSDEIKFKCIRVTDNATIRITLKFVGEVLWSDQEMLSFYNLQMRKNLRQLGYVLLNRYYFNPENKRQISDHKIELWEGLLTAINHYDGGLMMMSDTLHKVVRQDTVLDVLKDSLNFDRESFKNNAIKELTNCVVMTRYNNKTYRVDDIDFGLNPSSVFQWKDRTISIKDYYKIQYDIDIKDDKQPLIKCLPNERQKRAGMTDSILLVPELCVMTGLTESLSKDMQLKRNLLKTTSVAPKDRVTNHLKFMRSLTQNPEVKKSLDAWGLKFSESLVSFSARVLDGEKILMKDDTPETATSFQQTSGDFSKEIRGKQMRLSVSLNKWVVIVSRKDREIFDNFCATLFRVCQPIGFEIKRPTAVPLNDERTSTYIESSKTFDADIEFVVVIVPNNNKDRYDAIKKHFCCDKPIPSQVVVTRTLLKKETLMSVCTKIGIQMACKLGAEPWALHIPPRRLMVVGYDTYKNSGDKGFVGAIACTLNPELTRYYSRVSQHQSETEMSANFSMNLISGLKKYYEINGILPDRLIIYRDGVSDGQLNHVFENELLEIKEAINTFTGKELLRLVFIVVNKRVNAKFYLKRQREVTNPTPGTIIDTVVTKNDRYEFYLISQSVRHGTVSPTMFNIICDDSNWKAEHHQRLAYKLTHLYFNWPGTIKVPAPCQYAHKLASLTATTLHREPHPKLSDKLFYL